MRASTLPIIAVLAALLWLVWDTAHRDDTPRLIVVAAPVLVSKAPDVRPILEARPAAEPSAPAPAWSVSVAPGRLRAGDDVDDQLNGAIHRLGGRELFEWMVGFYDYLSACAEPHVRARSPFLYRLSIDAADDTASLVYVEEPSGPARASIMTDWTDAEVNVVSDCALLYTTAHPTFTPHPSWHGMELDEALQLVFPVRRMPLYELVNPSRH